MVAFNSSGDIRVGMGSAPGAQEKYIRHRTTWRVRGQGRYPELRQVGKSRSRRYRDAAARSLLMRFMSGVGWAATVFACCCVWLSLTQGQAADLESLLRDGRVPALTYAVIRDGK